MRWRQALAMVLERGGLQFQESCSLGPSIPAVNLGSIDVSQSGTHLS